MVVFCTDLMIFWQKHIISSSMKSEKETNTSHFTPSHHNKQLKWQTSGLADIWLIFLLNAGQCVQFYISIISYNIICKYQYIYIQYVYIYIDKYTYIYMYTSIHHMIRVYSYIYILFLGFACNSKTPQLLGYLGDDSLLTFLLWFWHPPKWRNCLCTWVTGPLWRGTWVDFFK